jgi:hypothetical protein
LHKSNSMLYRRSILCQRGERPESSGSHDWNKVSAADTARRQRAEQAQEQAELMQQYRKTDIASHIAGLRQQADTPLYDLAAASGVDRDKQERANIKYKLSAEG